MSLCDSHLEHSKVNQWRGLNSNCLDYDVRKSVRSESENFYDFLQTEFVSVANSQNVDFGHSFSRPEDFCK